VETKEFRRRILDLQSVVEREIDAAYLLAVQPEMAVSAASHILHAWRLLSALVSFEQTQSFPARPAQVAALKSQFEDMIPPEKRQRWIRLLETAERFNQDLLAPLEEDCDQSFTGIIEQSELISRTARSIFQTQGLQDTRPRRVRSYVVGALIVAALTCLVFIQLRVSLFSAKPLWFVRYYPAQDFSGVPVVENVSALQFAWKSGSPDTSIAVDHFSVRLDTCLHLSEEKELKFHLASDDGSRLFLNGELLIDLWSQHPPESKIRILRVPSGQHHLRVEYFESTGGALLELRTSVKLDNLFIEAQDSVFLLPRLQGDGSIACE